MRVDVEETHDNFAVVKETTGGGGVRASTIKTVSRRFSRNVMLLNIVIFVANPNALANVVRFRRESSPRVPKIVVSRAAVPFENLRRRSRPRLTVTQ